MRVSNLHLQFANKFFREKKAKEFDNSLLDFTGHSPFPFTELQILKQIEIDRKSCMILT